jgi:hypothetical protein
MPKLSNVELAEAQSYGLDPSLYSGEYTQAEIDAIRAIIARKKAEAEASKVGVAGATEGQTNTTYKDRLRLTPEAAKALLTKAAEDAQYTGTLSKSDIAEFIAKFQKEADAQMAIVIKDAQSKLVSGATATDLAKTVESLITTTYPSFFKADNFAKDYVWSKVNFADSKSLAGANLATLTKVRQLIEDFNVLGVSDAEIAQAAKDISMKKKTLEDYTTEIQQIAIKEHPLLADRFKANPTLTTKDIANPVMQLLAKTWEVDAATITLDNPIVAAYLHPGGADGKGATLTYADVLRLAKNDPRYEYTTASNDAARDSATSLARALGGGI